MNAVDRLDQRDRSSYCTACLRRTRGGPPGPVAAVNGRPDGDGDGRPSARVTAQVSSAGGGGRYAGGVDDHTPPIRRGRRQPDKSLLVRLASSLILARRRRLVRDLQQRAAWVAETRATPTLQQWTERMAYTCRSPNQDT